MNVQLAIIFLSFYTIASGQTVEFKGTLVDKNTKAPVVFANISFLNSEKGISTTQNGTFILNILEEEFDSKIHISCLNYKDTTVVASKLHKSVLYLTPQRELLEEVVVRKSSGKRVTLDIPNKNIISMHSKGLRMIAKYFPNTKLNRCCNLIEEVKIYFPRRNNVKSKFRFRIFDRDKETGLPKNDILKVNIPIQINQDTEHFSLDLSKYYIEVPKDGFFIAFEKLLIPFNKYYEDKRDPKNHSVLYSPILGWSKSKYFKNINRNYIFVKGKWIDLGRMNRGRAKGYVPSISVTLTD